MYSPVLTGRTSAFYHTRCKECRYGEVGLTTSADAHSIYHNVSKLALWYGQRWGVSLVIHCGFQRSLVILVCLLCRAITSLKAMDLLITLWGLCLLPYWSGIGISYAVFVTDGYCPL